MKTLFEFFNFTGLAKKLNMPRTTLAGWKNKLRPLPEHRADRLNKYITEFKSLPSNTPEQIRKLLIKEPINLKALATSAGLLEDSLYSWLERDSPHRSHPLGEAFFKKIKKEVKKIQKQIREVA